MRKSAGVNRIAVFLGPSLPAAERIVHPALTYVNPAARGDVERASREFDAVLLIDGVFHQDLAPSPKEVFAATQRCIVFGAASMGALRAAECFPYGMVPLGIIARWYMRGVVDGDDEVAVLVDPHTQTALTVPMVNVRYALRIARRRRLLNQAQCEAVYAGARGVYYMDRGWDDIFALVPQRAQNDFRALAHENADLKRHDALFALRSVLRRTQWRSESRRGRSTEAPRRPARQIANEYPDAKQ